LPGIPKKKKKREIKMAASSSSSSLSTTAFVREAIVAAQAVADNVLEIPLNAELKTLIRINAVIARRITAREATEAALAELEAEDAIVNAGGKRPVKRKKPHDTRISIINHNWSWNLTSLAKSGEYYHFYKILSELDPRSISAMDAPARHSTPSR
jgi:hypothetical protein